MQTVHIPESTNNACCRVLALDASTVLSVTVVTKFAQSTECGSDGIKTEVYRTEQVVMPHHKPM